MARLTTLLVTAVTLAACSTLPAMNVEPNDDSAAATRLRSYRTYHVAPGSSHGEVQDVAMGPAVVRSVDATLDGKGYRHDARHPDFFVKWHVSAPMMASRPEQAGTLILDVVDGGSNTIVWRGSARAALAGSGEAQTREDRIQEAVRRILERFPPQ